MVESCYLADRLDVCLLHPRTAQGYFILFFSFSSKDTFLHPDGSRGGVVVSFVIVELGPRGVGGVGGVGGYKTTLVHV